jgi:hypothetical protein
MAIDFRTFDLPGRSVVGSPRVSAGRGNAEYGDEDDQDEWEDVDGCYAPDLDDDPFDPEPIDDEIWDDFPWEDRSDDDGPPPEELWSDADWE